MSRRVFVNFLIFFDIFDVFFILQEMFRTMIGKGNLLTIPLNFARRILIETPEIILGVTRDCLKESKWKHLNAIYSSI